MQTIVECTNPPVLPVSPTCNPRTPGSDDILLHHPHHNLSRLFAHIGDLCCQRLPFSKDWNEDVPKPPIQNLAYRSFFLLVIYLIRDGPLHPFEIIAQAT